MRKEVNKVRKYINIDCVFRNGFEAWEIEVKDEARKVLEYTDSMDEDFEEEARKLRKKYEEKGYKVEVNIREE